MARTFLSLINVIDPQSITCQFQVCRSRQQVTQNLKCLWQNYIFFSYLHAGFNAVCLNYWPLRLAEKNFTFLPIHSGDTSVHWSFFILLLLNAVTTGSDKPRWNRDALSRIMESTSWETASPDRNSTHFSISWQQKHSTILQVPQQTLTTSTLVSREIISYWFKT